MPSQVSLLIQKTPGQVVSLDGMYVTLTKGNLLLPHPVYESYLFLTQLFGNIFDHLQSKFDVLYIILKEFPE